MSSNIEKMKKGDFLENLNKFSRISSKNMSISFMLYDKSATNKFSIIISSKTIKNATTRNKIKRRCFYAIKQISQKYSNGFLVIFLPKKNITNLKYKDIENEIRQLLITAKII
ncbi:MAG TPA: ribonuclease P protein component [Ignavibacteria bacterium]|nr:ribonuclease P protein component [Ignavibacteria bacterium]